MSKQRKQAYRSTQMSELARQLLYSPPERRGEAVRRAERFHDELEPEKNYPIDFVVYRLTDRRVPPSDSVMLVGEALRPDLRLLIDALSRSIEMGEDEGDPCETTAELARRLSVSTKTVARWRDAGLRWRWGAREQGGKPRVLIPRSAVSAFEQSEGDRVASASGYSRLSEAEKAGVLERARRLAEASDAAPQVVLEHLAKRTGRSVEALRQLVQQHDKDQPGSAVFGDRAGPLTDKQKRTIDRAYRRGVTVSAMCKRFGKTRSTIYRAIHEARALRALMVEVDVVRSPMFDREDADEVILRPIEPTGKRRRLDRKVIETLPDRLRGVYDRPRDSDEVTRALIVQYNYLKHRAAQVQDLLRTEAPRSAELNRFDELLERARAARGRAVSGALPAVLSVVRRQLPVGGGQSGRCLLAMLDAANAVLIDEVDRFDAARSHKFESVLTNRLLRELAKPIDAARVVGVDDLLARLVSAGVVVG